MFAQIKKGLEHITSWR